MEDNGINETKRKIISLMDSMSSDTLYPNDIRDLKKMLRIYRVIFKWPSILLFFVLMFFAVYTLFKDIDSYHGPDKLSD